MVTIRFTEYHDDTGAIGKYVIKANDFERSVLKVALAAKGFILEEYSFLENYGYVRVYDVLQKEEVEMLLKSFVEENAFSR